MAVVTITSSTASEQHTSSLSKFISRLRPKKSTKPKTRPFPSTDQAIQDSRPPLLPAPLPLVLPDHQASLPALGWTTITFPSPPAPHETLDSNLNEAPITGAHPLESAYTALFTASQAFFAQPAAHKAQWAHKLGTEEGWSSIPGEKEFITLRSLEYCPDILKQPAQRYWDLMGTHLSRTLGQISKSVGLSDDAQDDRGLVKFIGPCGTMQARDVDKTATMLRLFRYESWEAKVVAEPHADLGLLSVVVGNVPGLEVWNGQGWFDVERQVEAAGKKGASMLVGRQLERLTCGRFAAGGHRVVSYGLPDAATAAATSSPGVSGAADGTVGKAEGEKKYRFSIVFVLRAHEPLVIDSDALETEITGKWAEPMKGVTAGEFYEKIRGAHYNINIGHEEREKQKRNVEKRKEEAAAKQEGQSAA